MTGKKRKQHYVWKFYLKQWFNKQIHCLQGTNVFKSSLEGIANKRDFYKLTNLNDEDISNIKDLVIDNSPEILKEIHNKYIDILTSPFKLERLTKNIGKYNKESELFVDQLKTNVHENYHEKIESLSIEYLSMLYDKNLAFLETDEGRSNFLYYLCMQFTRTTKMKNNVIKATKHQNKIDVEKIWGCISLMLATNLAFNLNRKLEFKFKLLINNSKVPFITGDQPVLNTFAYLKPLDEEIKELEFYYPITPKLAILFNNETGAINRVIELDSEVHEFNRYILKGAENQVYSDDEVLLHYYKSELS